MIRAMMPEDERDHIVYPLNVLVRDGLTIFHHYSLRGIVLLPPMMNG